MAVCSTDCAASGWQQDGELEQQDGAGSSEPGTAGALVEPVLLEN